jgi:hypothetical protein
MALRHSPLTRFPRCLCCSPLSFLPMLQEYTEWEWFTWCLMPAGVFVAAVGLLLLAGILDPCVATIHAAISRDIIAPLRETAMDNSGGETVWAKMLEWADYHEAESLEALKQEKGARASTDGASGSCDERLDQPLLFSPISTSDATGAFDDGGGASMMSGGVKSTRMVQKNRSDDGVIGRRCVWRVLLRVAALGFRSRRLS